MRVRRAKTGEEGERKGESGRESGGTGWLVGPSKRCGRRTPPPKSEEIVKKRIVAFLALLVVLGACSGTAANDFQTVSSELNGGEAATSNDCRGRNHHPG